MVDGIREKIRRIETARRFAIMYASDVERISEPLITDTSLVDRIYSFVCERHKGLNDKDIRKLFLFAVLSVYSPASLVGTRMRHGLRNKIADTLKCSITVVSHSISDILFFYDHYVWYRTKVDDIMRELFTYLIESNIVTEDELQKYVNN